MAGFPIFDLAAFETASSDERRRLGANVDAICRNTGFLAVGNHGVPQTVIDDIWSKTVGFFDLTQEKKDRVRAPFAGYPYGYLGQGTEALAKSKGENTPPDLKESFNGGPLAVPRGLADPRALSFCYAPTIWPEEPAGFKQAWTAYYAAMDDLAARIMRVFATALELPDSYFKRMIDHPVSALRALNYPATNRPAEPGQLRAGAHTDYGSLTILLPQARSGGLQIKTRSGDWQDVPALSGAFVINIGDLMALWTNDRWVSTLHRVVNPDPAGQVSSRRQSLAFFHQPNWHQEIVCIKSCLPTGEEPRHQPVVSGPYLMAKFQSTVQPSP